MDRILMKLVASIEAGSQKDYDILALKFERSASCNGDGEHQTCRISPRLLAGDEVLCDGRTYCSPMAARSLWREYLPDFDNKAELCGRAVSVNITGEDPWVVNVRVDSRSNAETRSKR